MKNYFYLSLALVLLSINVLAPQLSFFTNLFLPLYLVLFLVLNLRQDRLAVLATRIKHFQIELLEEYLERKGDIDLGSVERRA